MNIGKSSASSSAKPSGPAEQISQLCRARIADLDSKGAPGIAAKRDVAAYVEKKLDPSRRAPVLSRFAAIEGITQIARACLRARHDPPEVDDPQGRFEAFSRELNDRYSIVRGDAEPEYMKPEETTPEEIEEQVIPMLLARRDAYQRHIDLLTEWNRKRRAA